MTVDAHGTRPNRLAVLVFISALPDEVDPCGENGEFHTFVTDEPGLAGPVQVTAGEVVRRDGFCFADPLPDRRQVC